MTYTVSSGTLNSSIPYHTFVCPSDLELFPFYPLPKKDGFIRMCSGEGLHQIRGFYDLLFWTYGPAGNKQDGWHQSLI